MAAFARRESRATADAQELIRELQRNPDVIPPYNTELVNNCAIKINELYQDNINVLKEYREQKISEQQMTLALATRQAFIDRTKRCVTTYLHVRSERIKTLRWKFGGVLPPQIKSNLSEAEVEFFNAYSSSLASFQATLGESGVNLLNNVQPPKTLFVMVRALQDYGEFETADGVVVLLRRDTVHSLPRQDCEMLIKQGILEYAH